MFQQPSENESATRRWTRLEVLRYAALTIAITVGVWLFETVAGLVIAMAGFVLVYLAAPFLAYPVEAMRYYRTRALLASYVTSLKAGYGVGIDLGPEAEQRSLALAGRVKPFRVFISSTFNDMLKERDILAQEVFPRLAVECERRGALWAPIDLRWGITELQQNAGEVVDICLTAVERCHPNTIGILGGRYGTVLALDGKNSGRLPEWVGEGRDLSITHLELRHAIGLKGQVVKVFSLDRDPASDGDAASLSSLRRELEQSADVVTEVESAESLAALVHEHLLDRLDREVPAGTDHRLLREISAHVVQEQLLISRPLLNEEVLLETQHWHDVEKVVALLGPPGSGRSTLMARWGSRWRETHPDDIVILRFVGLTEESQTWAGLLRSIMAELSLRTGQSIDLPQADGELAVLAAFRTREIQRQQRVVLGIDGIERIFAPSELERLMMMGLGWLPQQSPATTIKYIPMVVTAADQPTTYAYDTATVRVPPLGTEDRRTLVESSLASAGRTLLAKEVEAIVNHPQTKDPAFLGLLLDELHKVGSHTRLAHRLSTLLRATSTAQLLGDVLARVTSDVRPEAAADATAVLTLLSGSETGYTEAEVLGIVRQLIPAFDQASLELLRWRLASLIVEIQGHLQLRTAYRHDARSLLRVGGLQAETRAAVLRWFSHPDRILTGRAVREAWQEADKPDVSMLHNIALRPGGLRALQSALGSGYRQALALLADRTSQSAVDLLDSTVGPVQTKPADLSALAKAYIDIGEVERAAARLPDLSHCVVEDRVVRDEVLHVRGRLGVRGTISLEPSEWDLLLTEGLRERSDKVYLALTGMGAMSIRRGAFFWGHKYFKQAADLAFRTGNMSWIALAGLNAAISSTEGVADPLRTELGSLLHSGFDRLASMGFNTGDLNLILEGLCRRGVAELALDHAHEARETFRAVTESARDIGHEGFVALGELGEAVAAQALGNPRMVRDLERQYGVQATSLHKALEQRALSLLG
ncbi:DUF4062 domain-containing protein [Serinicoccus profundi]|uniref:DUF4062 domain-containing protein n=1 Tax=Serinicoccus profundi TaxID=1078471 RepID=UPI0002E805C2|nr:DUF4062 domain-containing protein [Serinicoccus profundi]